MIQEIKEPTIIDKNLRRLFESEAYTRLFGTISGVLTAEYIPTIGWRNTFASWFMRPRTQRHWQANRPFFDRGAQIFIERNLVTTGTPPALAAALDIC
jgi:hypothetical protein